jgi:3-hydroxybutyryl-CoA dehydrogenase
MIESAAVIGAGIMGVGIAQVLAMSQVEVSLYDASPEQLAKARERLADNLQLLVAHGVIPAERARLALANVSPRATLAEAVAGAGLVVEVIPERLDWKLELYTELEALVSPEVIIVSNTSTFPISELTQRLAHPERFIIAHFFNPAELVPLVEIVTMAETAEPVVATALELLRRAGKTPVRLKKDIPGFVANRLQAALLREALFLVQEGVVDPRDLDTVVSSGIGFRWAFLGPLEIADFGGLDTWKYVTENLFPLLDRAATPSPALCERVTRGELGIKTGAGFYRYTPEEINKRLAARDASFIGLLKAKGDV